MYKKADLVTKAAASLIILVISVYILSMLQAVIVPFLFAGIFAFLLYPVCEKLEKIGVGRILAITLVILLVFLLIIGLSIAVGSQISNLESLLPKLNEKGTLIVNSLEKFILREFHINKSQVLEGSKNYLTDLIKNSSALLSNLFSTTSNLLANLAIMPLYIFLFLLYRDNLYVFLVKVCSHSTPQKIHLLVRKINDVMQNYVVGLLLVIVIIGILNTISLLLLGIQSPVFFGFLAAFLVLIPYIGVAIGSLLPIIVALITKDSYLYAVGVAICFGTVQMLEGNFITPKVVGSKVSINSLMSILALLLFGSLWGITGLILAIPLTAILKVIFDSTTSLKPWGYLLGDFEPIKRRKQKK